MHRVPCPLRLPHLFLALVLGSTALLVPACGDDGGPCSYVDSPVTVELTRLAPPDEYDDDDTPSVLDLCAPLVSLEASVVLDSGEAVATERRIATVPQSFADEQGWVVGTEFAGTWSEIVTGTCSPTSLDVDPDPRSLAYDHCLARFGEGGDLTLTECPGSEELLGARCDFDEVCVDERICFRLEFACVDGVYTQTANEELDGPLCA